MLSQHSVLKQMVLRLIFNLTFDATFRESMDKSGFIPSLVDILKMVPAHRALVLRILYQLSQDDKTKATFTYTECLPLVYQLIIHFPQPKVGFELVALAVNLSTNSKNAAILAEGDHYDVLLRRAVKNEDVLLFKVVRNIAQFATAKATPTLEKLAGDLIKLAQQSAPAPELQIEVIGTLVYTHLENWDEVLRRTGLLKLLQLNIDPGMVFQESVCVVVTDRRISCSSV